MNTALFNASIIIKSPRHKFIKVDAAQSTVDRLSTVMAGPTLEAASFYNSSCACGYPEGAVFYQRVGVYETREVTTPDTVAPITVGLVCKTRDGASVRVLCIDAARSGYPVIALRTAHGGPEHVESYTREGHYLTGVGSASDRDLILPTIPGKTELVTKFWPEVEA